MSKLKVVFVQYDAVLCNYIVLLREGMCRRTSSVCFIMSLWIYLRISETDKSLLSFAKNVMTPLLGP